MAAILRYFRPCLRLYFRHPKRAIAAITVVSMFMFIISSYIANPMTMLNNLFSNFKPKPTYQSTDIFIPRHEYNFDIKEGKSTSLYGTAQCLLLELDHQSKVIEKFQKDLGELKCTGAQVTKLEGGVLQVKGQGLQDVSYQAIQTAKTDEDEGFVLGDRMAVVTAQVQLTPDNTDSIAHFLGKCIHPLGSNSRPNVQLVLWDSCGEERIQFTLEDDGTLRHKLSGFCVGPRAEIAESNKPVVLTDRCDDSTKFRGLENGFLQHLSSEMCVHFQSLDLVPPNDVPLVFYDDCEKNWKMRFGWNKDFKKGKEKETDINTEVSDEFIKVDIQYASGLPAHSHSEYHMAAFPKFNIKEPREMDTKPNMLLLMLHSVSYSHFRRKLPKTYAYLQKLSGTVFFRGYSVFDESSKSQLMAVMSGIAPESVESYNSFYELPWLHTLHKEQGYVTLMSEDKPCSGMYSDSICGFMDAPTDHFGQPFWAAAHKTYSPGHNTFCLGQKAIHNISLSYLRDFMTMYTKLPKYAAVMFSETSSWNYNALGYLDEDFARFLAWLKIKGHLDHTILTIFSNHGSKNNLFRKSLQGKMEERNPYLSITIPSKAPKSLLDALPTLRKNSQGLVTGYDLYATARRMVPSIPHRHGGLGENLLEPFKDEKKRSCYDLNIPKQWCPCLAIYKANEKDMKLRNAAIVVIEHVNKVISEDSKMLDLCLKLEFSAVKKSTELSPTNELLKFKWSKEAGKCINCKPVYGSKPNDMFYVLYIDVKEGVTMRAIVNIAQGKTYVHPHIVTTQVSKSNSCWRTQSDVNESWKMCVCK